MNNTIKNDEKFFKKIIKKQLFMTVITSLFLLFIIIGSSYAVFNDKVETGLTDVIVQSGNLIANISSTSETIELNYTTLGVSNEVGLSYEPYTFTVTNNGDAKIAYYELRIVDKEHEISTLPHKAINYVISKNGGDYTEPQNLGDNRSYIYVGGSLEPGESDTFNLKLWVNEEFGKYANNKKINASIEITLYSDIPTRNYINYDTQGGSYIPKTSTSSKRVTNQIPLKSGYSFVGWSTTSNGDVEYESNAIYEGNNGITLYAVWEEIKLITYNLNGGTGDIKPNDVKLGITTKVPIKEGFTFVGWATIENATTATYKSGDKYNEEEAITLYAVWEVPINLYNEVVTSLSSYLLEKDGEGAYDSRIISGNKDDENLKNYVWYSGKLWRIVALNNNGTIKLVTENSITSLAWDENGSQSDFAFEGSYIQDWLENKFLGTLYHYEDFIISEYPWNAGGDYGEKPDNTNVIPGSVGLLNDYEYYQSYSNAEDWNNGYLNINVSWWLLTPMFAVDEQGIDDLYSYSLGMMTTNLYGRGVRPSIVLKSGIEINGGTGTSSDPYTLSNDLQYAENNELLNTRQSGEFIKFNDTIFRITEVDVLNNKKITKISLFNNTIGDKIEFGNNGIFSKNTGIGLVLENWYNEIPLLYKKMILTDSDGVLWYQGTDTNYFYDYSKSKLGNGISATIGLPSIGDLFTGIYSSTSDYWLMTKMNSDNYNVFFIAGEGGILNVSKLDILRSKSVGVQPTFYLKSDVKIGDVDGDGNVGTGLPNDPYEIVCTECS